MSSEIPLARSASKTADVELFVAVDTGGTKTAACLVDLNACSLAGEQCKFLACVDRKIGAQSDNRIEMLGR